MIKDLRPNSVEWRICIYLIRERGTASSSEIEENLDLPSLFWAENYLSMMTRRGYLNKKEEDIYEMRENTKWNFLLLYYADYKKKVIQRLHFYVSFSVTLLLTFFYYLMYLPYNIITNQLYASIFSLFSILISIFEGRNLLKTAKSLGV